MKNNQNLRIALVWNETVFQERTFTQVSADTITVGEHRANDFYVPAPGLPEQFPMFRRNGENYTLQFTSALDGKIHFRGEQYDLETLAKAQNVTDLGQGSSARKGNVSVYELTLQEGDWGILRLGEVAIFFKFVEPVGAIARRGFSGFEWPLVGTMVLALAFHAVFLLVAELSYDPNINQMHAQLPNRFVHFIANEPPDPIEEEPLLDAPEEDLTAKKPGGEEGKFGDPEKEIPDSKIPKKEGDLAEKIDVNNIAITKALGKNLLGKGPLQNIFGDIEGFEAKMNVNVAMNGTGNTLAIGRGTNGMGMRGLRNGGGGNGFGRVVGVGNIDVGNGRGVAARVGGRAKKKVKTKLSIGTANVGQFCAKNNIRSVVRRGSAAVKYCFEKELQINPSLSGKVVLQWTVNASGKVSKAYVSSTTLKNKKVESCMVRVAKRWRFEEPKGGHCVISYPFTFKGAKNS